MADPLHVRLLKAGAAEWNAFRAEDRYRPIDLSGADLRSIKLAGVHLAGVNLQGADLHGCEITESDLDWSDLRGANLSECRLWRSALPFTELEHTNFYRADLNDTEFKECRAGEANFRDARMADIDFAGASLVGANFSGADLREGWFEWADLHRANLCDADLTNANLNGAVLTSTLLVGARCQNVSMSKAIFGNTVLSRLDMSSVGIESTLHLTRSSIDRITLASFRELPVLFLRGFGLSDWEIEGARLLRPGLSDVEVRKVTTAIDELRRKQQTIGRNIYVAYAHKDAAFIDRLEEALKSQGIRCWRHFRDSSIGLLDHLVRRPLDDNPYVVLVLSTHSVEREWMKWQIEAGRELAEKHGREVLLPVAIDDAWLKSAWIEFPENADLRRRTVDVQKWSSDAVIDGLVGELVERVRQQVP